MVLPEALGTLITSGLSILGCIFIITTFLIMRPSPSILTFVFYLSISDLIVCGTQFLLTIMAMFRGNYTLDIIFWVIDIISGVCTLSTFFWTTAIALYHFRPNSAQHMKVYRFVCFGVPAFIIAFFEVEQYYQSPAAFVSAMDECLPQYSIHWLGCNGIELILIACAGMLSWIFILITYSRILLTRRKKMQEVTPLLLDTTQPIGREQSASTDRTSNQKIMQYSTVFFIWFGPFLLYVIMQIWFTVYPSMQNDNLMMALRYLVAFTVPLQGFFNALIYGLSNELKQWIRFYISSRRGQLYIETD